MREVYPYRVKMASSKRIVVSRSLRGGGFVSERIDVDLPLRRYAPERYPGEELILEGIKQSVFDKFIFFLQIVSENYRSFPREVLRRSRKRRFFVLVSPQVSADLQEWGEYPQKIRLEEFELEFLSHHFLEGGPAFIVERNKYCLYLYFQHLSHEVRVFRSEFIEMSSTVPPMAFSPNDFFSILPSPERASEKENSSSRRRSCPRCHGRLVYLASEEAFCLSCDWDNLKTLPESFLDDLP